MDILITTPTFPPANSGLGNAVLQQAGILRAMGLNVTVATSGAERKSTEAHGLRIEEFNISGSASLVNPIKGDVVSYTRFLTEANFDLVLMNAWQIWSTDIPLKNLQKIRGKKILCSHCVSTNLFFWDTPFKSFVRYMLWRPYFFRLKNNLQKLDALVALAAGGCDSRFDDVRIAKSAGTAVYVIPNALPCSVGALATMQERKQLISVGSYEWQKGHDFVLRAYADSNAKNRIPLKIFGQKFTPYTETLKALAADIGIQDDYLSFHEGVSGDALIDEYKKSLAFVYGSHTECQPLVLLDAMASGTPFVSRASGCIDSMPGGLAVNTRKDAVAQINLLLEDPAYWQQKSDAGVAGARLHSHESVSEAWAAALQKIIGALAPWPTVFSSGINKK